MLKRLAWSACLALCACAHEPYRVTPNFDARMLDTSIAPCSDFYGYACHTWIHRTDLGKAGDTVHGFDVANRHDVVVVIGEMAADAEGRGDPTNPDVRRIGDFMNSCMDDAQIAKTSFERLEPELALIDGISDADRLASVVAHLQEEGVPAFFNLGAIDDSSGDATTVIADLDQGGLTLDRETYFQSSPDAKRDRQRLVHFVSAVVKRGGATSADAAAAAEGVLKLETALAKSSASNLDRRNLARRFHRSDWEAVAKTAPDFHWHTWLAARGLLAPTAVNVAEPDFLNAVEIVLASTPLPVLRAYLRANLVLAFERALPRDILLPSWGIEPWRHDRERLLSRFERCVGNVAALLGEPLGRTFVHDVFSSDSKERNVQRLQAIEAALARHLDALTWMDEGSKAEAKAKLAKVRNQIGYPEAWLRYDELQIDPRDYLGNVLRARRFRTRDDLARIGHPIDRSDWEMPPYVTNAYYEPIRNEMVFPAGILQPPFFNAASEEAANFGAIGEVMGHELTHGFDDQGRKFDAAGKLRDWWSTESAKAFGDRAQCLVKQFNGYVAATGHHVNGQLTLGENIADLGGIGLAYDAYEASKPPTAPIIDGYTPEQQFFLAYAQLFCEKRTEENAIRAATNDVHAPGRFRVNGPLSNLPAFHEAFGCKAGDPMVRPESERCSLW